MTAVRQIRLVSPQPLTLPPGCTPGAPCPCCGQVVPAPRSRSVYLRANMELERARWGGRVAFAIAQVLGDHECDAFRIFARMAEKVGEPIREQGRYRFGVRHLAREFALPNQTLHARWQRAGLPELKLYVDGLWAVRAAAVVETYPEEPAHRHGKRLGFDHMACYARWLRRVSGVRPARFASTVTEGSQLERFLSTLVRPHVGALGAGHFISADVRVAKRLAVRQETL